MRPRASSQFVRDLEESSSPTQLCRVAKSFGRCSISALWSIGALDARLTSEGQGSFPGLVNRPGGRFRGAVLGPRLSEGAVCHHRRSRRACRAYRPAMARQPPTVAPDHSRPRRRRHPPPERRFAPSPRPCRANRTQPIRRKANSTKTISKTLCRWQPSRLISCPSWRTEPARFIPG
jgi:hypothetical protein